MEETDRDPANFESIERYCSYVEIEWQMLFTMFSEDETLFILTDSNFFITKRKEKISKNLF